MKLTRFILPVFALAVVGISPLTGQEPDEDRARELEQQLRNLRREMREVERELGRSRARSFSYSWAPGGRRPVRVLNFMGNRARLGVVVRTAADDATDPIGAVIESVSPESPADEGGLEGGDVIVSFNGEPLAGRYPPAGPDESEPAIKLVDLVGDGEVGDTVIIEYRRDGQTRTTTVVLRDLDEEDFFLRLPVIAPRVQLRGLEGDRFNVITVLSDTWSDIELVALNEGLASYFGTDEGLLVIRPPSDEALELEAGDVILSIDGRTPRSPSRALRILRSYEPGEALTFEIMRNKRRMTVSATVPEDEGLRDFYRWDWDRENDLEDENHRRR